MSYRLKNKCTTAVTIELDGKNVTIPAGELSREYKKASFDFGASKLLNACLLIPIAVRQKLPMAEPIDSDPRKPSPITTTNTEGGTVWSDKKIDADGPISAVSANEIKSTNKRTKSKADK